MVMIWLLYWMGNMVPFFFLPLIQTNTPSVVVSSSKPSGNVAAACSWMRSLALSPIISFLV